METWDPQRASSTWAHCVQSNVRSGRLSRRSELTSIADGIFYSRILTTHLKGLVVIWSGVPYWRGSHRVGGNGAADTGRADWASGGAAVLAASRRLRSRCGPRNCTGEHFHPSHHFVIASRSILFFAAIFVRLGCLGEEGGLHRPGVLVWPNSIGCSCASISASQLEVSSLASFIWEFARCGFFFRLVSDWLRPSTGFCEILVFFCTWQEMGWKCLTLHCITELVKTFSTDIFNTRTELVLACRFLVGSAALPWKFLISKNPLQFFFPVNHLGVRL